MMAMLVRLETQPDATDILDVPVSYIARIMFQHGQQSFLTVREEGKPIGTISLRPAIETSGERSLHFSGALAMELPLMTRQRFNFNGTMDMDRSLRLLDFRADLTVPAPHYHLSVSGNLARKTLTCEVSQGNQQIASQTLPLDAAVLGPALLQNLGLDPSSLLMISPANIAAPSITARETQITLHGEQLDVYQVTIREGTATMA